MEVNVAELKNKGMVKDYSISKSPDEYAFDNLNIRITPNVDNTGISITNEKGPAACLVGSSVVKTSINRIAHSLDTDKIKISLDYTADSDIPIVVSSSEGKINKIKVQSTYRVDPTVITEFVRSDDVDHEGYITFVNKDGAVSNGKPYYRLYLPEDKDKIFINSWGIILRDFLDGGVFRVDSDGIGLITASGYEWWSRYLPDSKTKDYIIPKGSKEFYITDSYTAYYSISLEDNVDYIKSEKYYYMLKETYDSYISDNKPLPSGSSQTQAGLSGSYCGKCETSDSVVIFTYDGYVNYIYNVKSYGAELHVDTIYKGGLNITPENMVDAIFRFESEDVQKVYWVDGVNQPRVINIAKPVNYDKGSAQFDFISTVDSVPRIDIRKEYNSSGLFPAGTIQYGVSYYNKFGSETNLLWFSTVHYITFEDRAAKADENVACQFRLKLLNLDTKFDYVRVYSCVRTSLDAQPIVSIVGDYNIAGQKKITVYDNNVNVVNIDPSLLYYIGGREFVASTITSKQDRLFLGNIRLSGDSLSNALKNAVKNTILPKYKGKAVSIYDASMIVFDYKSIGMDLSSTSYPYKPQTLCGKEYFSYFKYGEIYRFAIQFQTDKGNWTQPIWIGDKKCTLRPKVDLINSRFELPTAALKLDESVKAASRNYIMYRVLIAETSTATRNTIAQGVLSPTMFSLKDRINNSPYAVSSWIMRPIGDVPSKLGDSAYLEIQSMDKDAKPSMDSSLIGSGTQTAEGTVISLMCTDDINAVKKNWAKNGADTNVSRLWDSIANISIAGWDVVKYRYCLILSYSYNNYRIDTDSITIHCESRTSLNKMWSKVRSYILRNLNTDISDDISKSDFKRFCKEKSISSGSWSYFSKKQTIDASEEVLRYASELSDSGSVWGIYKKVNVRTYSGESNSYSRKLSNSGYFVDDSIVTFNSPDIEPNQEFLSGLGLNMRIVGYIPITAGENDMELDVSEKGLSDFASKLSLSVKSVNNISKNYRTLLSDYLYEDSGWFKNSDDNLYPSRIIDKYKIYLWHKSESINGMSENSYPTESGDTKFLYIPSNLKRKVFASKRFSLYSVFFDNVVNVPVSSTDIIYDGKAAKSVRSCGGNDYYFGDVDTLLTRSGEVTDSYIKDTGAGGYDVEYERNSSDEVYVRSYDPVRIRYKSSPHVVIPMTDGDMTYYRLPEIGVKYEDVLPEGESYPWVEPAWVADDDYVFLGLYNSKESAEKKLMDSFSEVYKLKEKTIVVAIPNGFSTRRYKEYYIVNVSGATLSVDEPVFDSDDDSAKGQDVTDIPMRVSRIVSWDIDGELLRKNIVMLDDLHNITWREDGETVRYRQISVYGEEKPEYPYLYLAELYRDIPYDSLYGGYGEEQIKKIKWIVSSSPYPIDEDIPRMGGDTYYQRWDCLKTYPYSEDDVNSVVDITSFMVETHTNIDGRCDINRKNSRITLARPTNYNLFNQAYNQTDNLFSYNILDSKYDLDRFGNQIVWSNAKVDTDEVDSWTNINMLSSLSLDGSKGDIRRLINFNDSVIAFQDKAISVINYNNPTQISTESGSPIEVVNSGLVNGYSMITGSNGCQNKWGVCKGGNGVYFMDDINKSMLSFSRDGLQSISAKGFSQWFKDNIDFNDRFNIYYDSLTKDVYVTNGRYCLSYNEQLDAFSSFYSYEGMKDVFNLDGESYAVSPSERIGIYRLFGGNYGETFDNKPVGWGVTYKANPEPMIDKIFTNLEYTADIVDGKVDDVNYIDGLPLRNLDIWNEYQKGSVDFTKQYNALQRDNARKFRLWRVQLPRDEMSKNRLDRIRNTWCYIKLSDGNPLGKKVVLHNVILKYYK